MFSSNSVYISGRLFVLVFIDAGDIYGELFAYERLAVRRPDDHVAMVVGAVRCNWWWFPVDFYVSWYCTSVFIWLRAETGRLE